MSSRIRAGGALLVSLILSTFAVDRVSAAVVSRSILKSYFLPGSKPTSPQFATLLDSTVILADDRYLLGLKVYDPTLIYTAGDTVVFKRFGIGDTSPELPLGTIEFAPASELTGPDAPALDMAHDFAGQSGFLPIQLQDSAGIYNGYFQLSMEAVASDPDDGRAIFVEYIVYNDVAGAPITMTLVPEPGSVVVIGACAIAFLRRRVK